MKTKLEGWKEMEHLSEPSTLNARWKAQKNLLQIVVLRNGGLSLYGSGRA